MSANNWRKCPQCIEALANRRTALAQKIEQSYGKVTEEEYVELLLEQPRLQEKELAHTLREDWEIGIWNGVFRVSYRAHCEECGFVHEFNCREVV